MAEKWTAKKVEEIISLAQDVVSLNTLINPIDGNGEEIDAYIEDTEPSPEEEFLEAERHNTLVKYLDTILSKREADIIKLRFGIDSTDPMTLEEIGVRYDLTRERVRQLECKALRKLRIKFMNLNIKQEDI